MPRINTSGRFNGRNSVQYRIHGTMCNTQSKIM
jgi:hypothetical protein